MEAIKLFKQFSESIKMEVNKLFKQFIESIKVDDKIGILHHLDSDGICSAVITTKALERLGKKIELRLNQSQDQVPVTQETIKRLKEAKITKLFILDLGVHQDKPAFKPIEEICETIIIDHHKPESDLSSKKTTTIYAGDLSKNRCSFEYPTSKMCFDLFSNLIEIKELGWITAIGIFGDKSEKHWSNFIKQYEIFSKFSDAAEIIDSALVYDKNLAEDCFRLLINAQGINEVINSDFAGSRLIINEEIDKWAGKYKELAEIKGNLIFYTIKPDFSVCSKVATIIHKLNPDKTIIVVQDLGNEDLTLSARSKYYDVVDLLRNAIKGLENSTAGGHKIAAGGRIKKINLAKFKGNIMGLI